MKKLLERYPRATLRDIYKSFFQDYFGPAHIIADRNAVIGYIEKELASTSALSPEYYEPCGWRGRYVRVNLSVVRDGLVSMDELADLFMASATGVDSQFDDEWVCEWEKVQSAVRAIAPDLVGFEQDSLAIARVLADGKYVMHHSRQFNECYHPHYRIVRRDLFEREILPHISGSKK